MTLHISRSRLHHLFIIILNSPPFFNTASQLSKGKTMDSPKFFQVILNPQAHNLRIPEAFVRTYGRYLREKMCLKVPDGSLWKVKLDFRSDGEIWIQEEGWEKFRDNYSISIGHFLVFDYVEVSCFEVLIYDSSATEIDYTSFSKQEKRGPEERMEVETGSDSEDDDIVLLGEKDLKRLKGKGYDDYEEEADEFEKLSLSTRNDNQKQKGKAKVDSIEPLFPVRRSGRGSKILPPDLTKMDSKSKTSGRAEKFSGVNPNKSSGPIIDENQEANPCLEIVVKKHHRARLGLPKQFAEAAGLIGKTSLSMEYPGGTRVDGVEHVFRRNYN